MKYKRKPIIALILSILVPGLGHLYNDKLKKGCIVYVIVVILLSKAQLFGFFPFLFGILLSIVGYIHASVDSYRYSKKIKEITLKKINR